MATPRRSTRCALRITIALALALALIAAPRPLLADGDTGYGEALNVMHMVRSFEDAGAAAVHIEDQLLPKKCGHLNDKKLADAHDMAAKIAAAAKARRHLFIVARTDAERSGLSSTGGATGDRLVPTTSWWTTAAGRTAATALAGDDHSNGSGGATATAPTGRTI